MFFVFLSKFIIIANIQYTIHHFLKKMEYLIKRASCLSIDNILIANRNYCCVKYNVTHFFCPSALSKAIRSSIAWLINPFGRFSN